MAIGFGLNLDMASTNSSDSPHNVPSSDDSDKDQRRTCTYCNTRMSNLNNDKHSLCAVCRGGDCDVGNKCNECMHWSEEEFAKFLKHRKVLESKNRHRKKNKEGSAKASQHDSLATCTKVTSDKNDVPASGKVGIKSNVATGSGDSLSRRDIVHLVSESVQDFGKDLKSELASHLKDAYGDLLSILERKLGPLDDVQASQDATNPPLSETPAPAPDRLPSSQGRKDPPALTPRQMPVAHGGEQQGLEQGCRLNPLYDFIFSLVEKGIQIPDRVISLVEGLEESNSKGGEESVLSQGPSTSNEGRNVEFGSLDMQGAVSGSNSGAGVDASSLKSVTFADVESVVREDDAESVVPASQEAGFRPVASAIYDLHPASIPSTSKSPSRDCEFEGLFAPSSKESKDAPKFNLHHKVEQLMTQTRLKFVQALEQNKASSTALPGRKKKYGVPNYPSLGSAPPFNPNLTRLMDNVSVKRSVNFSYDEVGRVEGLARHQLEIQSMMFWLFSTIIRQIKEVGFAPKDPVIFENLIYNMTLSLVNSVNSLPPKQIPSRY